MDAQYEDLAIHGQELLARIRRDKALQKSRYQKLMKKQFQLTERQKVINEGRF